MLPHVLGLNYFSICLKSILIWKMIFRIKLELWIVLTKMYMLKIILYILQHINYISVEFDNNKIHNVTHAKYY